MFKYDIYEEDGNAVLYLSAGLKIDRDLTIPLKDVSEIRVQDDFRYLALSTIKLLEQQLQREKDKLCIENITKRIRQ